MFPGQTIATFQELVELLVIGAFKHQGVSYQTIRWAHDRAKKLYSHNHPFATRNYSTDGVGIFTTERDPLANVDQELTEELSHYQLAFRSVVEPFYRNLEYNVDDVAVRLWPLGVNSKVVLDPMISFGKPVESSTCVPTWVLYETFQAEKTGTMCHPKG
jgi:hypothetical protein